MKIFLAWLLMFGLPLAKPAFAMAAGDSVSQLDRTYRVGSWIWDDQTYDKQTCRFWRAISIPREVIDAHLRITADNAYLLYLDGEKIGQGSEWQSITDYPITTALTPGRHIVAIEAFNESKQAGVLTGVSAEFSDGTLLEVASDASWWVVRGEEPGWKTVREPRKEWLRATVIAPFLSDPWKSKPGRIYRMVAASPVSRQFWQTGWFQITLLSVCGVIILICLWLVGELALQKKAQRLLRLERVRIARDFHDDLGARLTQAVLLGELAQRELPENGQTRAKIDQICGRMRDLSGAINEIVWMVNSQRDTLNDFAAYVCDYAEAFLKNTSLRCRFDVSAELPELSFELPTRRNLFLAVKESLNNAVKHSGGDELFLRLHHNEQAIFMTVEDNGRGFDVSAPVEHGNGLKNITQRMKQIGGTCAFQNRPGGGCIVSLTLPLARRPLFRRWRDWPQMTNGAEEPRAKT